uniref:Transposase n=1 Tax=Cucumis melo TaxID=3656 RepID=A0A9I9E5H5_CUCME
MANNMKAKFEKYWGNNEKNNLLLYVAIVLDPRKKLRFVSFCLKNVFDPEVAESMENVAEQCCRRLFHKYSTTRSGSRQGCSSTNFVYDTIVEEFKDDSTTPFKQGSSEIDIYLLEANVRTEGDFDILQWWKMNSDQFEVLGHMARDILAIPVSTVASESAFSTGGHVVDSSRCSLAPKTVEAFICTQNWLNSDPIHLQFQHELEEASKFEEESKKHKKRRRRRRNRKERKKERGKKKGKPTRPNRRLDRPVLLEPTVEASFPTSVPTCSRFGAVWSENRPRPPDAHP